MPLIKVPKDNRHLLEPSEVARMIELAPTLKDKSIIAFYYITGARAKEPLNIKKEDIWMDDKWLYIKFMREKKSKKEIIPIPSTLSISLTTNNLRWIIDQWNAARPGEVVWFYGKPDTARVYIWKMIKKANPDAWIHLFRHTRNDYFRRKGKTREQRMAWFGWIDSRTPDRYGHPDEKDIKELGESIE